MHSGKHNIKRQPFRCDLFAFCVYNVVIQKEALSLSNQPPFFADAIRLWHQNVATFKSKENVAAFKSKENVATYKSKQIQERLKLSRRLDSAGAERKLEFGTLYNKTMGNFGGNSQRWVVCVCVCGGGQLS